MLIKNKLQYDLYKELIKKHNFEELTEEELQKRFEAEVSLIILND